mmetsp:Transcript_15423/g.29429  ORF Transcript_15423/g.29429 Transcript_15423/m.29429 type:complete len:640 (-) Transcript_15423:34-1953(-)
MEWLRSEVLSQQSKPASQTIQSVARRYAVSRTIPMKLGVRLNLEGEIGKVQIKMSECEQNITSHQSKMADCIFVAELIGLVQQSAKRVEAQVSSFLSQDTVSLSRGLKAISHCREVLEARLEMCMEDLSNLRNQLTHLQSSKLDIQGVHEQLQQQFNAADAANKELKLLADFLQEATLDNEFIKELFEQFVQGFFTQESLGGMTWEVLQNMLDGSDNQDGLPAILFLEGALHTAIYSSDNLLDGNIEGLLLPLIGYTNHTSVEVKDTSVTVAWKSEAGTKPTVSHIVEALVLKAMAIGRRTVEQVSCETKSNKKGTVPLSPAQLGSLAFDGRLAFIMSSFTVEQPGMLAGAARFITLQSCNLVDGGVPFSNAICGDTLVQTLTLEKRCPFAHDALMNLLNNLSDALTPTEVEFLSEVMLDIVHDNTAMQKLVDVSVANIVEGHTGMRCFQMDAEYCHQYITILLAEAAKKYIKAKSKPRAFGRAKAHFLNLGPDNLPFSLSGGHEEPDTLVAYLRTSVGALEFEQDTIQATDNGGSAAAAVVERQNSRPSGAAAAAAVIFEQRNSQPSGASLQPPMENESVILEEVGDDSPDSESTVAITDSPQGATWETRIPRRRTPRNTNLRPQRSSLRLRGLRPVE